jgi:hypothetical protein
VSFVMKYGLLNVRRCAVCDGLLEASNRNSGCQVFTVLTKF